MERDAGRKPWRSQAVSGSGRITVNKKPFDEYFPLETLRMIVRRPSLPQNVSDRYDIVVNVRAEVSPVRRAPFATGSLAPRRRG